MGKKEDSRRESGGRGKKKDAVHELRTKQGHEGNRNKDESLLLNTSTHSRRERNMERNEATVSRGASCIRHVEG